MDKSLVDQDANNVFVFFVQNPHDVRYREPVIDEEIADGDLPFRDRVKGCRILRARKHLFGDTETASFQRFGECHGGLSGSCSERKMKRKKLEMGGGPAQPQTGRQEGGSGK